MLPQITALPIPVAYAQVNLGRRKISGGLAAIGVGDGDANDRGLDSMIWRGTSASDAVFLLEKGGGQPFASPDQSILSGGCKTIGTMSGANLVAGELVAARLAMAGTGWALA